MIDWPFLLFETGFLPLRIIHVCMFRRFVASGSDGKEVELLPNGSSRMVTFKERTQYCELVESFRLHEFDNAIMAIRNGLASLVPNRALVRHF